MKNETSKLKSRYDLKIEQLDRIIAEVQQDIAWAIERRDIDEEWMSMKSQSHYEEQKEKVIKERSSLKGKINETIDRLKARLHKKHQPTASDISAPKENQEASFIQKITAMNRQEKKDFLASPCPEQYASFDKQTNGQRLYGMIDDELKLQEIVGTYYFPEFKAELERLRENRCQEIMNNTKHLYHYSQVSPENIGTHLQPKAQETGNALSEDIMAKKCYASADKNTQYIAKISSNKKEDLAGVCCYMDEKITLIDGRDPVEYLKKLKPSYRYEVDKSSFKPVLNLDGQFTNEYDSKEPARIINSEGPFDVLDMCIDMEIPLYFCPGEKDKDEIIKPKVNEYRNQGLSRVEAMAKVNEEMPDKLIDFSSDKKLQEIVKNQRRSRRQAEDYERLTVLSGRKETSKQSISSQKEKQYKNSITNIAKISNNRNY